LKKDNELVDKIGELARLNIEDKEKPMFSEHLKEILDYMEVLNNVNVQNVEPMSHGCVEVRELRPDVVVPFDPTKIMTVAHKSNNNYFEVPNIIDGDEE